MPIQVIFKAQFRWPVAYAGITTEYWLATLINTDGTDSISTVFDLGNDVTNSTVRNNLFSAIKADIDSQFNSPVYSTETHSFATVGSEYVWTIDIVGVSPLPFATKTLVITNKYFFTAGQNDAIFASSTIPIIEDLPSGCYYEASYDLTDYEDETEIAVYLLVDGSEVIIGSLYNRITQNISEVQAELTAELVNLGYNDAAVTLIVEEAQDGESAVFTFQITGTNIFPVKIRLKADGAYEDLFVITCPECDQQVLAVCDTCLELTRQACQESYTFDVDLEPATEYTVAITLPSGNIYTQEVITNGSGSFTIDAQAPEFPSGLFLPETGPVKIEVFADASLSTPLELVVNATQYTCINLNFAYITTTTSSLLPEFSFLLHDYEGEINFQIITDQNDSFLIDE